MAQIRGTRGSSCHCPEISRFHKVPRAATGDRRCLSYLTDQHTPSPAPSPRNAASAWENVQSFSSLATGAWTWPSSVCARPGPHLPPLDQAEPIGSGRMRRSCRTQEPGPQRQPISLVLNRTGHPGKKVGWKLHGRKSAVQQVWSHQVSPEFSRKRGERGKRGEEGECNTRRRREGKESKGRKEVHGRKSLLRMCLLQRCSVRTDTSD